MKKALKWTCTMVILAVIIILTTFAWAKYITTQKGQIESDVAEFYFRLTDGEVQESGDILFAITRNDGNTKVADKMLAPGTSGKFKIGIDASRNGNFYEI